MGSHLKQPLMLRCRDSHLMKVILTGMDKWVWFKVKIAMVKARMGIRFSADFQIFSYKILWPTKTKKFQDKVAEPFNQLIISSTQELQEPRNIHREKEFRLTIFKAMKLFLLTTVTIITQSLQVVALTAPREAHLKMQVKTKTAVFS